MKHLRHTHTHAHTREGGCGEERVRGWEGGGGVQTGWGWGVMEDEQGQEEAEWLEGNTWRREEGGGLGWVGAGDRVGEGGRGDDGIWAWAGEGRAERG